VGAVQGRQPEPAIASPARSAPIRLVFVIASLGIGGAERVVSTLASHWATRGWGVTILTFDDGHAAPSYRLDARVRHQPLDLAGDSPHWRAAVRQNIERIRVVRRAIRAETPDAVLSFIAQTNVVVLCATRGLGVPVLVSERTDPYLYPIPAPWVWLRRRTYGWADQVVVLNERARSYFPPRIRGRTTVIPNPVVVEPGGAASLEGKPLGGPLVVSMGRLAEEKGHDLLLRAFARVRERFPDWSLAILGEGPWRPDLERLRDELGLAGRAWLPGVVRNPHGVLREADLFVLPSRHEGFPMALAEAMACGLPVIATEYHEGVRDIVRDGVDGVLVSPENVDALAAALGRLMEDEAERRRLAARGQEIRERFGLQRVAGIWEELLARVTERGRR
jgi:glycosyltransferase involved in cell wall biosynthesis